VIYVASSWRNPTQPAVIATLRAAGLDCYDFRNPPNSTGFSWRQVRPEPPTLIEVAFPGGTAGAVDTHRIRTKGADLEQVDDYLTMVRHPVAVAGFKSDFDAMVEADTFVLVLPCGKSAHLELGWAVGRGKRTAVLLDDPAEPELMYLMVDKLATNMMDLLDWLGVVD
jgi:hypothetical protein